MPIYCLAALTVIFITACVIFLVLSKKKLVTRENITNLVICTVLAMVCTTLTPLWASLMVKGLYFSVFMSVVLSFILSAVLTIAAFKYIRRYLDIKELAAAAKAEGLTLNKQQVLVAAPDNVEDQAPTNISNFEIAAVINENAFIHQAEEIKLSNTEKQVSESPEMREDSTQATGPNEAEAQLEMDKHDLNIAPEPFDLTELMNKALDFKQNHDYPMAISYYKKAILLGPNEELLYWIVADLCALYKKSGQKEQAVQFLQSDICEMLKNEVKQDILQNL